MDQTIVIYPIKFVWINHFELKEFYLPSMSFFKKRSLDLWQCVVLLLLYVWMSDDGHSQGSFINILK